MSTNSLSCELFCWVGLSKSVQCECECEEQRRCRWSVWPHGDFVLLITSRISLVFCGYDSCCSHLAAVGLVCSNGSLGQTCKTPLFSLCNSVQFSLSFQLEPLSQCSPCFAVLYCTCAQQCTQQCIQGVGVNRKPTSSSHKADICARFSTTSPIISVKITQRLKSYFFPYSFIVFHIKNESTIKVKQFYKRREQEATVHMVTLFTDYVQVENHHLKRHCWFLSAFQPPLNPVYPTPPTPPPLLNQ